MILALENRGFGYGSGIISPNGEIFIANVPKNASSYVLDWASRQGWHTALAEHVDHAKIMLVLLRDPVERWISGIAQYINTYILSVHGPNGPIYLGESITKYDYVMTVDQFVEQYNDLAERLIFDVISGFDDHVWPQWNIVHALLPMVPRKYFMVDNQLTSNLADYLGWTLYSDLDRNDSTSNKNMLLIKKFFHERLEKRPELMNRIKRHYHKDYELIDWAIDAQ